MLVDKIKTLCDERGETLASLERKMNFGNGTIRRWDNTVPSGDKLAKVADFFRVSVDYLLGRVDNPNEYWISGNAYPDVMRPFLKRDTSTILAVDEPDINATDEDKRKLIEEQLKKEYVFDHQDEYSLLLSLLPKEKRNDHLSLYDLFYIIGSDPVLMDKLKELDPDISADDVKKEKPDLPQKDEPEITFDDFTYAFLDESKELTEENKQKLLEMAKFFKQQQDKEKNE